MIYELTLKNASEKVFIDAEVRNYFDKHPYYGKINLLQNLRKHSSGCAVYQKVVKNDKGEPYTETIYLHKLIAEIFLSDKRTNENKLVGSLNGNKLDCRRENIVFRSRPWASRQRKTTSKTGFMGVYKENKRYRSVISYDGTSIHIGMFDTAEEAAAAYNKKSWELYGDKGKQNPL